MAGRDAGRYHDVVAAVLRARRHVSSTANGESDFVSGTCRRTYHTEGTFGVRANRSSSGIF